MFSNDLKNEIIEKFNLTESIINSSKHYKIPKFVFKLKGEKIYNKNYFPVFKSRVISLNKYLNDKSKELNNLSKTQYFERKRENINNLLSKIQREKIDLLINRAYHKNNDNIREYNNSLSLPRRTNKIKLDFLPLVQRQTIINHLMNQTEKYLPFINNKYEFMKYGSKENKQKNFDEEKKNRQMSWSYNFIQQKKLEQYEKIYRIKYLNNDETEKKDKFKDEFIQKDLDNPKTERHIFSFITNKSKFQSPVKKNQTMNSSKTTFSAIKPKKLKNINKK